MAKRAFDLFFSVVGLLVLSPLLLVIALAVKLSDGGSVFFRQTRIGRGGRCFQVLKFRSMVANAEHLGSSVTADGDKRVTRLGRFLRKHKLDELPQLWNVFRGEMSFVGPRPEVPRYVDKYTAEQKRVLALKPGITDLATLEFRNEEEFLTRCAHDWKRNAGISKANTGSERDTVEDFYLQYCVPRKIELNLAYAADASVWSDVLIILRTLFPFCETIQTLEGHNAAAKGERVLQTGVPEGQAGALSRAANPSYDSPTCGRTGAL